VKPGFARAPFQAQNLATSRFIEFTPVKSDPLVASWLV